MKGLILNGLLIKKEPERIWNVVKLYQYVSFDIFDTLIKRNVPEPGYIFDLTEREGRKRWGDILIGFARNRKNAEASVRKRSRKEEITLSEIYIELKNMYAAEITDWLWNKELELEYILCTKNNDLYKIYRLCLQNSKKIIITSDMYLPEDNVIKMLRKCGIDRWEHFFLSCNIMHTKQSGSMYDYMLETLHLKPGEVIHLGDDRASDYIQSRRKGIASVLIPKNHLHVRYPQTRVSCVYDECTKAFINNTVSEVNESMQLGYECFGPLLFGFTKWLMKEVCDHGIRDVFFLSRDGYILKKAFDLLNDCKDVTSHYFYASRRAFRVPMLAERLSYEEFVNRNFWEETVSSESFVRAMGVEDLDIIALLLKDRQGYCIDKRKLSTDLTIRKLYYDTVEVILPSAIKEKKALHTYIYQEKIGKNKSAVVDIGWHGNMQLNLVNLLQEKIEGLDLSGYYIGITPNDNHKDKIAMKGFVFDEGINEDLYYRIMDVPMHILLEQVFMAPHGSVKSFSLVEDEVKILFYEPEQTDSHAVRVLHDYQNGALEFVRAFKEVQPICCFSAEFSIDAVIKQFTLPQIRDIEQWKKIVFKDLNEEVLVCDRKVGHYLLHPLDLLSDYRKSIWKCGYMKKVFKLNLNYNKIIKLCQKVLDYRGAG